jgi:pimeloyl-ACP methyl ester carboxylesterase
MRTRLSLLALLGIALLSTVSCTVDRAIEGQSRWFYRVMESEEYVIPLANGDSLSVLHTGKGQDTLVFVHGFGPYPRVQWQPMVWGFGDKKSMFIVDLLSFGASTSADSLISVPRQSESILAGLDSLGVSKFHLVGHSYGGMVSAYLAGEHPERLHSLVLIDPLNRAYRPESLDSLENHLGRPIEEILLPADIEAFDLMHRISVKDVLFVPEFVKQRAIDNIYSENVEQRQGLLRAVERDAPKLIASIHGYNGPTMLLWGAEDAIFSTTNGEALLADYPQGFLKIIEDCGHTPHMEKPFEALDAFKAFYADVRAGK